MNFEEQRRQIEQEQVKKEEQLKSIQEEIVLRRQENQSQDFLEHQIKLNEHEEFSKATDPGIDDDLYRDK